MTGTKKKCANFGGKWNSFPLPTSFEKISVKNIA